MHRRGSGIQELFAIPALEKLQDIYSKFKKQGTLNTENKILVQQAKESLKDKWGLAIGSPPR